MWKNHGARPGDVLFLTKPIGIGVLTAAQRGDLLEPETHELMILLMTTRNKSARDVLVNYDVHACTDVTGFSFLGHLYEMCSGSDVSAEIDVSAISLIPEALELARIGILPEGMYRNMTFAEQAVDTGNTELAVCDLLFDPQTSGGLLAAVSEQDAEDVYAALKDRVPCVQRVGRIVRQKEKTIYLQ
jgi:selenide,water dikinase